MPRRTSPAGTIHSRACAGWNASAHHTSSAAPPRPTATRLAAVAATDENDDDDDATFAAAPGFGGPAPASMEGYVRAWHRPAVVNRPSPSVARIYTRVGAWRGVAWPEAAPAALRRTVP